MKYSDSKCDTKEEEISIGEYSSQIIQILVRESWNFEWT